MGFRRKRRKAALHYKVSNDFIYGRKNEFPIHDCQQHNITFKIRDRKIEVENEKYDDFIILSRNENSYQSYQWDP
jgi:hypothetical protein